MIVHFEVHRLPFHYPFTISSATKTHQPTLVVALQLGRFIGFGEAPAISYYNISVEKMAADLEARKNLVEKFAFTDPERFWHYLHHLFPDNPFLVCALDMAGWDLWGKMRQKPLFQLWETSYEQVPLTDYTIGLDSIDTMLQKVREKPWPIYKIKLGSENDLQIMEAIREQTPATLRVDVNGGWGTEEAMEKIRVLTKMGVELVEQPLHKDNWDGMKQLYDASSIPLIADESCVTEKDVEKCVGFFHGVNIKLTKCSGITPALRMIKDAKARRLKVMIGSMNESSIGSSALAQFLPQVDFADIDGPLLLSKDLAEGLKYDNGHVLVKPSSGLGISVVTFGFQQN